MESQVQNRSQKTGAELAQYQPDEKRKRCFIGAQTAVSQNHDLAEPADEDRQPEPKKPKTSRYKITRRVEGPPDEPCPHSGKK